LHVAVAIVGFRNSGDIIRCLNALAQSLFEDFEVVICENGGTEAFEILKTELPPALPSGQKVSIICSPTNLGFAGGVNNCIRATPTADAWWILNPDTEPSPKALHNMVVRLNEGDCDGVGNTLILSGGLVQSHGGIWQSWLGRAVSIGIGESSEKKFNRAEIEKKQNYLNGASMIVNRRFLNRTGMMREDYFLYCEEVEWCLRATRQGIKLGFAEEASVLHHVGTTTGRNRDAGSQMSPSVYLGHRNVILMTKDCFPDRLFFVALCSVLLIPLRFIRRGTWRQLENAYSGWMAGLRGERGRPEWMA